ncbi:RluA family pseudouridine synthase [Campylobacter vulpis]|uniref:RluA family pseudouridine synthase n=1 Tax=Campylobacter vulpis TaxID=1655500 RepID=UPI001BCCDD76|nr:RluA family pseudouridine synthase [Campylobacter vulpis]MBS4313919.1 RluA family pseudouridine synthase [Campylobacter vulpis]MBS4406908.1 RluA family pseudouridine synthase [Campylobacter vulpis]
MQTFLVDENLRLDVKLAKILNQSRSQISLLIENNAVLVNDVVQNKNSFKLKQGDLITLKTLPQKELKTQYEVNFDVDVLFEDDDILVLNKPQNLVVHGASSVKEATLVDWLLAKKYTLSNLAGELRAGLVHRLDKETSGAIIIAKNNFSHQFLSEQLQDKSLGRIYLALIDLPLKEDKIILNKALVRSMQNRIKKVALEERDLTSKMQAKEAKSAFINLALDKDVNLIAAKLFSGRTHQIRAHLASINRHILGDTLYGYKGNEACRVMLHAYYVYFKHPKTNETIFVKAPLMQDFKELLEKKLLIGEDNETISLKHLLGEFNSFI